MVTSPCPLLLPPSPTKGSAALQRLHKAQGQSEAQPFSQWLPGNPPQSRQRDSGRAGLTAWDSCRELLSGAGPSPRDALKGEEAAWGLAADRPLPGLGLQDEGKTVHATVGESAVDRALEFEKGETFLQALGCSGCHGGQPRCMGAVHDRVRGSVVWPGHVCACVHV